VEILKLMLEGLHESGVVQRGCLLPVRCLLENRKLDRVGRPQDLTDARWLPASSPPFMHQDGNGGLHKCSCFTTSKLQILYFCFFGRVAKFIITKPTRCTNFSNLFLE
jgi:hypothetical protein